MRWHKEEEGSITIGVRASKKWVTNMVPIQLVWMEPEDG
jgi:hypothetical protein